MRVFLTNEKEMRVLGRQPNQTGVLYLSTRVEVRGNHLKGEVPVKILYRAFFIPDEEFMEKNDEYPEEESYSVTYANEFLAESERDEHCRNWYEILPDETSYQLHTADRE